MVPGSKTPQLCLQHWVCWHSALGKGHDQERAGVLRRAGAAPRRRERRGAVCRAEDAGRPHAARVGAGRAGAPGQAVAHVLAPHMPQVQVGLGWAHMC